MTNAATSSQNDRLFSRGKAMSGAPIKSGTNQLPKPPIIAGITMKKIMMTAWAEKNTLYRFLPASCEPSPSRIADSTGKTWPPGNINSARMAIERIMPMTPAKIAKAR